MMATADIGRRTLDDAFQAVVRRNAALACVAVPPSPGRNYAADGLELSYGEMAVPIDLVAATYDRAGYGHGHRVALLLENRPEFLVHFLALNRLGISVVPVNPDYRYRDLAHLFERSVCDLAVVLDHRVADIGAVSEQMVPPTPAIGLGQFSNLPRARRATLTRQAGRSSEAVLLFTSGTSGMPKGCVIDNDYLYYAAERYLAAGGLMTVRPECERLYNPLPLFYANSVSISNPAMILSGNCMIFPDRFHPKSFWRDLVSTRATMIHYLGIIPPVMIGQPEAAEERGHKVRFGIGAGIEPTIHAAFERRFGFPLIEVWGMSEVGIVTAANHEPRQIDTHTIGTQLWDAAVAIATEDGVAVAGSAFGELLVRREGADGRRGFFREYLGDPAATAEAWRDGWFHTGDLVRRDDNGVLYFVDRLKNMIRRSGQNISAAEVETCLREVPGVGQAAVVAVPDELREEEVMACIVPTAHGGRDAAAARSIFEICMQRLAYFKAPAWLLFLDELPTTATQKMRKADIFAPGEDPRVRAGIFDFRAFKQRAQIEPPQG